MRAARLIASLTILAGCATAPDPTPAPTPQRPDVPISAIAVSRDGKTLWYAAGESECEVRTRSITDGSEQVAFTLPWCPRRISPLEDGSVVVTDGARLGSWRRPDGTEVVSGSVLAAAGVTSHVAVVADRLVWRHDGAVRELGAVGEVRWPAFIPGSGELLAIVRRPDGERLVRFAAGDEAVDAGAAFEAIDSFAIAPRGDELVFSAYRGGGFDVAISSTDGRIVNWIPPDRADEVGVTWAPRGNKVSYLIPRGDGTLGRTVHVPSSFQLTFETPYEIVRALAWEPRAERVAMILEGTGVSPHVDWAEYGGGGREPLGPASLTLSGAPERVVFGESGAILLAPKTVRYGQTVPLFVMLVDEPLGWDRRVRDLESLGGGVLRVERASWGRGESLGDLLASLVWASPKDVFVIVDWSGERPDAAPGTGIGQTLVAVGTKPAGDRLFATHALPSGGTRVDARTWEGALAYLRARFQAGR